MIRIKLHAFAVSHWYASILNKRRLQQLLLLLCMVGATELSAVCQVVNTQSAVDNLTRSSMHVDPSTGALQFQIPLGDYRGRGEAGLPVTLRYSSKLWTIKHHSTLPCNGEPVSHYYADYAKGSVSGWTSSVGWFLPTEDVSMETYATNGQPATPGTWRIMRKYVTLPDGSRHEMRRDDSFHTYGENQGGVYYAVDGSRMWWDWTDPSTNTLYLPNGSRIVTTSGTRQYIDRNGNVLTFNNSTSTWSDTLGRSIGVPFGATAPGAVEQTYTLPGGLTYKLRWRYLGDALTDPSQPLRYKGDALISSCTPGGGQPNALFFTLDDQRKMLRLGGIFNPLVLWQIELPNVTSKYTFTYNVYGEIDKVVYPTGGSELFTYGTWDPLGGQLDDGTLAQANRGVLSRAVSDGVNPAQTWSYNGTVFEAGVDPATAAKSFTRPDGTVTKTWYYKSRGAAFPTGIKYGFDDARAGMAREVRVFNSAGIMLRRTVMQLAMDGPLPGGYSTATRNARVTKTVEIILDTGGNALAAATEMTYDSDLNVTITTQYDYVSISQATGQTADIPSIPNGTLLRTAETDYLTNNASYRARNLLALPTANRIKNGAGTIVAQSSISYDEAGYPLLPCGASTWIDPATTARGNATTSGSWLNTTGTYLQAHAQYDQCGSLRYSWDAKGNQSQIQYSSTYAYAYPTYTQTAVPDPTGQYGSTTSLVTTSIYDINTDQLTSSTDANNQTTSYTYADALKRPTLVTRPTGGGSTSYVYDDTPGSMNVKTSTALDTTPRYIDSYQYFDGLGRTIESRQYEGGTNYVTVKTQYDSMGRADKVSNPYRPWQSEVAIWTTTGFDALSRVLTVTTPDSAVVSSSYSGNTVTVTDQTGKARKSVTDALGRLKEVYEDPSGLNYLTSYSYDTLDNLTTVTQGTQTRTFVYDSLKRLTSATNPESGAISYTYDNNSNLLTKTDARGVVSTYTYDALNRNTLVDYSDTTTINPDVTRIYDGAINGKGRFWYSYAGGNYSSGSNVEHTAVDSYDALGRPLIQRQIFKLNGVWGPTYPTQRAYNLAGGVTSQTYPSGRTVAYSYDSAGRTSSFSGYLGDSVNRTYSTAILYSPFGGMTKEQFGTDTTLYNKLFYNSRGQLAEIRDSTTYTGPTDTTWNRGAIINFNSTCWGMCGGSNSTTPMTDNNGNLKRQEVYIPNDDQISSYVSWAQTYDYDSLNRLQRVTEGSSWQQEYVYDRYGNRTIHQTNTWGTGINKKDFTVNTGNNRLGVPGGQSGVMTYDNAGNLTNDTYTGAGSRTYDAENRMSTAWGGNNQSQAYNYNADGQRTRRKVDGVETWQIYGMDGELVAEYAASAAATSPQKEYGYRNGQLLITAATGSSGNSLSISGSASYMRASAPASSSLNITGAITVEAWIKLTALTGNQLAIVERYGYSYTNNGGYLLRLSATGKVVFATMVDAAITGDAIIGATTVTTEVWHHVAGVFDGNQMRVYLDGALDGSKASTFAPVTGTTDLEIGISGGLAFVYPFNGLIDEARVSTGAVYTSNFTPQAQLSAQVGTKGLWKFDGQTTSDASGNGNNGTLQGSATYSIDVPTGGAAAINWLVTDQLDTPRMIFDSTGALASVKRHDYLPFGEELLAGQGARSTSLGYAADNIRQKFTQKERDNETGLDYFLARYYSSSQGRFTSPDEFSGGPDELYYFADDASENPTFYGDLRKPQSLNKYQYSYNNPLRWVDPDGHDPEEPETPQDPKPVVPVPVPVGPGLPVPITLSPTTPGPSDQQIIRGAESLLDKICDVTGITAVADWLRPKIMPTPAPTTGTPPTSGRQPVPPPPITMGKGSTRDVRKINPGREAAGKKAVEDARAEVTRTKGVRNKTAADVEAYNAAKRALKHALDKLKKSETDARKGRGNR